MEDTESVPMSCTCGAFPPDDAKFCHKCGRPLVDLMPAADAEDAAPPDVVVPPAPPLANLPAAIDFRNRKAVRAGLFTASLIFFLSSVPLPALGAIFWRVLILMAGGFLSVVFYRRWTGEQVSLRGGARMGWITGVFSFVLILLLFTLGSLFYSGTAEFTGMMVEQMKQQGQPEADVAQMTELLRSPSTVALVMILLLAMLFLISTVLPSLGGALAAKVFERD